MLDYEYFLPMRRAYVSSISPNTRRMLPPQFLSQSPLGRGFDSECVRCTHSILIWVLYGSGRWAADAVDKYTQMNIVGGFENRSFQSSYCDKIVPCSLRGKCAVLISRFRCRLSVLLEVTACATISWH